MSAEPKFDPSRAGGVGGRASARPAARAIAAVLAAMAALMIAVPAASAAIAPKAAAPVAVAPILADPVPAPSPSPSGPGIVLGPGAPTPTDTVPAPGATGGTSSSGGNSDPSFWDIPGQIEKAINDWFAGLVTDALNPVLNLLGSTVLSTPDVTTMPRVGEIWTTMALLANGFYVLLILAGGVIVMTHETLQTRYAMKDIAPRLFAGFLVGNASLAILGLIIHLANTLAAGIMGQGLDPKQAGTALAHMITGSILNSGGIFLAILGLVAAVMAVVLLVTYMVRVALMVLLAVAAPVALSLHALPQTEGLARLWWRAVIGTLAVQLGQSLTLITALRIFLDPGGQTALGFPTGGGLTDLLVFITLFFILIKIPFWVGRSIFGRSQLLSMAKGIATYKLMGAVGLVPLQAPDLMVEALDHALSLGLKGVEISSHASGVELSDPRLEPFWHRAGATGAVVFLHPFGCTLDERLDRWYLSNIVGQPAENAVALSHLIFVGVLDRHPDLKLLASHGGGYLPTYIGRADHGWKVRPDSHDCAEPPSTYLRRVWFDSLVHDPSVLRNLVAAVGADHVVLGSDYPFDMGVDDPVERLAAVGLTPSERAAVQGGNAARLFGIKE